MQSLPKMTKEIGSEFWTGCTPVDTSIKYSMRSNVYNSLHTAETLSGRTALEYIVELLVADGRKSVYMPSYCCHTMIEPFNTHGMSVRFYDIILTDDGLRRQFDEENDCDVVFLMDYFGHIDSETAKIAKSQKTKGKVLVCDVTHSMYSPANLKDYDYVFGSYRKWVDINCGFVAFREQLNDVVSQNSISDDNYPKLRERLFDLKADYMCGRISDKQEFLDLINVAEEKLEENYHHKMPDERSMKVLRQTDVEYIKSKRRANGLLLTELINNIGRDEVKCFNKHIANNETPLFIPIYVNTEKRDALRRHLIQKSIYCPVHWPLSELHRINEESKLLYQSELSIICDQRYDRSDMERIGEEISLFLKS